MARKFEVAVKCPGCKMSSQRVRITQPKFMTPTFSTFVCDMCESHISIKVGVNPDIKEPGAIRIWSKVSVESETLRLLKDEEKAEKEACQKENESLTSEVTQPTQ